MKTIVRRTFVIIIVIMLITFGIILVKRKKHKLAQAPKYGLKPIPVWITRAKLGSLSSKIDYLAIVEPFHTANISARLTATIEKVLYDEGGVVKANEPLVILDGREIVYEISSVQADIAKTYSDLAANQATVKSLKDSVEYWKREAKRDKTLADKGDIPASQAEATADKYNEFKGKLDSAINKSQALRHLIDSLKKKQDQIKTRLSYCKITSPYNGIITRRLVDPGDLAVPGKNLMIIEDRSQLKLAFDIPQRDTNKIHEGLTVLFTVNGQKRSAKLSHLYPSLNEARMLRAEVFLSSTQSAGLSCGEYVSVSVVSNEFENVILLPASCVIEGPRKIKYVFTIQNDKLAPKKIKILASTEETVALEGIKPNEQVVTNTFLGWAVLSSGKEVEIVK